MTAEEHKKRPEELHRSLDELLSDFLSFNNRRRSRITSRERSRLWQT